MSQRKKANTSSSSKDALVARFIELESKASQGSSSLDPIVLEDDFDLPSDVTEDHDWEAESKEPGEDTKDAGLGNIISSTGPFRLNATQVFLTYPQAPTLTKERILEMANAKGKLIEWYISQENHHDTEGIHFHAYLKYQEKHNWKSARTFDIKVDDKTYHPNIQPVKNAKAVAKYVCKDGNMICHNIDVDYSTPVNFVRRQADVQEWRRTLELNRLQQVRWPISLPDGTSAHHPGIEERKRHWWITGTPGCGKTYWAQSTFCDQKVFIPTADTPYPFEGYAGEEVIIFDDWPAVKLTKKLLVDISNVYLIPTQVPGATRYRRTYWPMKQARSIFILTNDPPFDDEWFTTRFHVIYVTENIVPVEDM